MMLTLSSGHQSYLTQFVLIGNKIKLACFRSFLMKITNLGFNTKTKLLHIWIEHFVELFKRQYWQEMKYILDLWDSLGNLAEN